MPAKKKAIPSPALLVSTVRSYCRENAQPDKADKWARYFSEGYDAWGLLERDHPVWTSQQDAWSAGFAALGPDGFIEAGCELFRSGKYEEGALAIRFLKPFSGQIDDARVSALTAWFDGGIRNWAHVDVLCGEILSPLVESGQLRPSSFKAWRTAPHRFQRRAAAVVMLGLLKTKGGPAKALAFIEPMMQDREKVAQQGLGWLIKEAWKLDPATAESFLAKHKDTASHPIITIACEKMPPEKKALFKAAKKKT